MQLGALLAGDPARYPTGSQIAVQTATSRDADVWVFTVGEEETLSLPAGEFVARKLSRAAAARIRRQGRPVAGARARLLAVTSGAHRANGDYADFQVRDIQTPSPTN